MTPSKETALRGWREPLYVSKTQVCVRLGSFLAGTFLAEKRDFVNY